MASEERRARRRRRRGIVGLTFFLVAFGLSWFFESQATTTVVLIRHADRAVSTDRNPGLSPAGHQRAGELVRVLDHLDVVAGPDVIFATQYRRTQETAEPLAKALQLPVQIVEADDIIGLAERILAEHKGKVVLVIGHSNSIPQLIREFHGSKKLAPIEKDEYDNLYVLSIPWFGKVKTLQLKYGVPYIP